MNDAELQSLLRANRPSLRRLLLDTPAAPVTAPTRADVTPPSCTATLVECQRCRRAVLFQLCGMLGQTVPYERVNGCYLCIECKHE